MSAVSYSSPYKGSGHAGYVCATAHSHTASLGMTQAPVASMGSTSAYIGRGVSATMAVSTPAVTGFTTAASAVRGGMMASATYARMGVVKREPGHNGEPGEDDCPYCHDDNGDGVCDRCGCDMEDCTCEEESGYCWCPIDCDWKVWLFMAAIAAAYAASKRKAAVI